MWLVGNALPLIDRFPSITLALPGFVQSLAGRGQSQRGATRPEVEWAAGRVWNQRHTGQMLEPLIRVDLMWPRYRCAVEIDGPDHRGGLKYAHDRRRDNTLVLAGFAVLRFTNDEVADDTAQVTATIERLLTTRRYDDRVAP